MDKRAQMREEKRRGKAEERRGRTERRGKEGRGLIKRELSCHLTRLFDTLQSSLCV
jgi:hypothetical protein